MAEDEKNAAPRDDGLLRTADVARRLNVSEWTVRRLINTGRLPSIPLMRHLRVDPRDLERFISQNKIGGR